MTGLLLMATVTLLAACGPTGVSPRASVPAASETAAPTPAPTFAAGPSPTSASPSPPLGALPTRCSPYDPVSQAVVSLSAVGEADTWAQTAINADATAVVGGTVLPGHGWRQPDIAQATYVTAGAPLTLWAWSPSPSARYCLGSLQIVAAPFSPLGEVPDPAAVVVLDGAPGDGTPKPAFVFHAPAVAGGWVVSVRLDLLGQDRAVVATQTSFLRLEVDRPAPGPPVPAASPRTPCGRPMLGENSMAPATLLMVDGGGVWAGQFGLIHWDNAGGTPAGEPLPETSIALASGTPLTIAVKGHVCALAWRIVYAAIPPDTGRPLRFDPLGVLAEQRNPARDPAFASANEIALGPLPRGEWVLRAELLFADGSTAAYWRVLVR